MCDYYSAREWTSNLCLHSTACPLLLNTQMVPMPPTLGGEKLRGDFQLLQRLESNVLQCNDQLLRFSVVKLDRHIGRYFITRRRLQWVCRPKITATTGRKGIKKGNHWPHTETICTGTRLRSRLDALAEHTELGAQLSQVHTRRVMKWRKELACQLQVIWHCLHSELTWGEAKIKGIFYCWPFDITQVERTQQESTTMREFHDSVSPIYNILQSSPTWIITFMQ